MTYKLFIPIKPMGAVRTTQKTVSSGKSVPYRRYHAYKQEIAEKLSGRKFEKLDGLVHIKKLIFYMPIPKYLNGKVDNGHPHSTKPDIDNAIKGVMDAFNDIAWTDDNRVYKISECHKEYNDVPGIYIEWEQTHELPEAQVKASEYRANALAKKAEKYIKTALKLEQKKIKEERRQKVNV